MVSIRTGKGTQVYIAGHGLAIEEPADLGPGISVSPKVITFETSFGSRGGEEFQTHAAVLSMERLATFSIVVEHPDGGEALARKSWNAIWLFGLLALACRTHVISLYSGVPEYPHEFSLTNRHAFIRPLPCVAITPDQVRWAANYFDTYNALLGERRFRGAQRYYNNAHYLPDADAKIMLLWAGIESLLDVDAELRRSIALHAAILHGGESEAKAARFRDVKRAYDIRSKVVHGADVDGAKLEAAVEFASDLLLDLLRRTLEIGRMPKGAELDEAASRAAFP